MKPALISDWDSVLFWTDPGFNAYLLHHYGITIPDDVPLCGYSIQSLLLDRLPAETRPTIEAFYQHVGDVYHATMLWHESAIPVEDSVEVVQELSHKYDLYVATARMTTSAQIVEGLTGIHFPNIFSGYHYVHRIIDGKIVGTPKRTFAERLQSCVGFVDDNLREIREMGDLVPSYLFDPKGFHRDVTDCTRVTSWRELADRLL